jgi:hypothetical protein
LTRYASLTKEISRLKHGNYSFFARRRSYADFYRATLNVLTPDTVPPLPSLRRSDARVFDLRISTTYFQGCPDLLSINPVSRTVWLCSRMRNSPGHARHSQTKPKSKGDYSRPEVAAPTCSSYDKRLETKSEKDSVIGAFRLLRPSSYWAEVMAVSSVKFDR